MSDILETESSVRAPWKYDPDNIVMEYQRLAYSLAAKYQHSGVPLDDLRQEALLGILDAAQRYQPERGTLFSTYAVYWIRKRILKTVQQEYQYKHGEQQLLSSTPEPVVLPENSIRLELPPDLSELETKIIQLSCCEALPLNEITQRTGLTVEKVKQLRGKALRRIRSNTPQV